MKILCSGCGLHPIHGRLLVQAASLYTESCELVDLAKDTENSDVNNATELATDLLAIAHAIEEQCHRMGCLALQPNEEHIHEETSSCEN